MILFQCTILGRPIVKKNTQRTNRKTMARYNTDNYKMWAVMAKMACYRAKRGELITKPVRAIFHFYFKDHQAEADLSNLAEGPSDILKEAGVLKDDKLIHELESFKHFGETPRTEITIHSLEEK